ncbi:hypothetical protein CIB48_g1669 [Xylaria polymorpha]|nr:hypothetical protein CIB48_g1669 [Xylaria polymorpha]
MSVSTLPIIYITGATATGKTIIGKILAGEFNLYHVSMGDLRRAHLASLQAGVPEMGESIRAHVKNNTVIPDALLAPYTTVPAVLAYHNHRASKGRGWSTDIASIMLNEAITRANDLARAKGGINGIIIDGHPLTSGNLSQEIVQQHIREYGGLTIVLESPREVARQRYLNRARLLSDNKERFEKRMELTNQVLPEFIEYMAGFGEIVRSNNDETMWIEDVYDSLLLKLKQSNAWLTFTKQN